MQTIVIYGKGGIGKSTLSAALSESCARAGRRVLHVGCDPKHDSAMRLVAASAREAHDGPDSRPHGACTWSMQWALGLASFAEAIVDARRHASRFFGVVPLHLELPRRLTPLPCVISELGFPSIGTHAVSERPYYGFRGVATLVERLGGLR